MHRPSVICALLASRGRVGERAGHFLFDPLHCAGADAHLARRGVDAHARPQQLTDLIGASEERRRNFDSERASGLEIDRVASAAFSAFSIIPLLLRGKPYPVIGTFPFGVVDHVPGEIEDSLASEFVLP
jgi:hypothetical protein